MFSEVLYFTVTCTTGKLVMWSFISTLYLQYVNENSRPIAVVIHISETFRR